MIVSLWLLLGVGTLFASEVDEMRQRAKAMRKEAAALSERGNREQAEQLERESSKLMEAAERLENQAKKGVEPGSEKEVRKLKERLQDLLARERKLRESNVSEKELIEVREQIAGTEKELHLVQSNRAGHEKAHGEFRAHAEKLEAVGRRIHHLRAAAEHLKLAESHDLALQLMEKAEALERDVHAAKKKLAVEMTNFHAKDKATDGEEASQVRELKEEIEKLRGQLKKLSAESR